MLARTEGTEVMEPTKVDYEVSAKPPPQPLQPAADGALGFCADAPFCASCRPWCPVLRASWTSCMASELTIMPVSTTVQTGSERGRARAPIMEGLGALSGKKMATFAWLCRRLSWRA